MRELAGRNRAGVASRLVEPELPFNLAGRASITFTGMPTRSNSRERISLRVVAYGRGEANPPSRCIFISLK